MATMTEHDWETLETIGYFRRDSTVDNWGDPWRMDRELMYSLQRLREYVEKPIIVHCGWEHRAYGFHPKGMAVDIHIGGMHVVDQFLAASRITPFAGIGVYPYWNNPGLHLDTRPESMRYLWAKGKGPCYVALNWAFLRGLKP